MSPSRIYYQFSIPYIFVIYEGIFRGAGAKTGHVGVRPVINLKSDILITKGDGSALSPFVIS